MTSSPWPSRIAIVVVAIVAFEAIGFALVALGTANLGYDFEAYLRAASRVLDGQPLYDLSVNVAGGFAIFLYPPPFGLAFTPFALVSRDFGLWQWEALLVGCLTLAIAQRGGGGLPGPGARSACSAVMTLTGTPSRCISPMVL